MTTIKEAAEAYVPQHNISELPSIDVNESIMEAVKKNKDGEEYKYKFIVREGEEYKIPNIVLSQLKTLRENNPKISTFKVIKKGEGIKTSYQIIPLDYTN